MTPLTRNPRPGVRTVFRWELRKLIAQPRSYLGLGAVVLVPLIFVAAVALDDSGGSPGLPYGAAIRSSGLAVPLVSLSFGAFWLIPLVTALVAGDIIATEHQHATWKTLLTRSVSRRAVWSAKAAAAAAHATAALVVFLAVGAVAGLLVWGWHPLPLALGGQLAPSRALLLLGAAAGVYLLPTLALASLALMLSTVTRNSAASIIGTLLTSVVLQLVDLFGLVVGLRPYLLTAQFTAWTGLFTEPVDWAPVIRAVWTCGLVAVVALSTGLLTFLRRDVVE